MAPVSGNARNRVPSIRYTTVAAPFRLSGADKRTIREFARLLDERVAGGRGFDCLLAGDEELTRLNRDFLHHDYPTDVLSFPSGLKSGPLGELAISLERAAAQAREFGHSIVDEIRILLLHGVLHLIGMDHERDKGRMARVEPENWAGRVRPSQKTSSHAHCRTG